jgi:hypothetical protein
MEEAAAEKNGEEGVNLEAHKVLHGKFDCGRN